MINFILKFWVEWLFGIIGTGLIALAGFLYKKYKNGQKALKELRQKQEEELAAAKREQLEANLKNSIAEVQDLILGELNEVREESEMQDLKIHVELGNIKDGLRAVQGSYFKKKCKQYLKWRNRIRSRKIRRIRKVVSSI